MADRRPAGLPGDDTAERQPAVVVPEVRSIEVEQDIVVRLFPREFHWVEVEAEYLGPGRPRIPRELEGIDE